MALKEQLLSVCRAQNNQSKLAKAKRQIGIKLHNEYRFVDKQARCLNYHCLHNILY